VAVALNKDGAVAKTYASGIPTTVIIGKDGIIKAHHVGLMPEDKLSRTVQAVLDTEGL